MRNELIQKEMELDKLSMYIDRLKRACPRVNFELYEYFPLRLDEDFFFSGKIMIILLPENTGSTTEKMMVLNLSQNPVRTGHKSG